MMKLLQQTNETWVYVYDETKAIKTGISQWDCNFFATPVSTDGVSINPSIRSEHSVCYVRRQQGGHSSPSG